MITILTHVCNVEGSCNRCGRDLKELQILGADFRLRPGLKVGVIEGHKHTPPGAYAVGANDSNKPCEEI